MTQHDPRRGSTRGARPRRHPREARRKDPHPQSRAAYAPTPQPLLGLDVGDHAQRAGAREDDATHRTQRHPLPRRRVPAEHRCASGNTQQPAERVHGDETARGEPAGRDRRGEDAGRHRLGESGLRRVDVAEAGDQVGHGRHAIGTVQRTPAPPPTSYEGSAGAHAAHDVRGGVAGRRDKWPKPRRTGCDGASVSFGGTRSRGIRSPCHPCHRSGRPSGRPSPACRPRRPRW